MSEKQASLPTIKMLFIIVHQVYELWFKGDHSRHGLGARSLRQGAIDERNLGLAISRLNRVIEIQKVARPADPGDGDHDTLDFLDFRHHLFPASGFQSYQFRQIETMLGLPSSQRLTYKALPYRLPG